MRIRREGKSAIWSVVLLVACGAVGLCSPASAAAEPASFYANFSKCPTGVPAMNDPSTEEAACFSNITHFGSMKVGSFDLSFDSPMHIQFAVNGADEATGLVDIVPGSTSLEAAPTFIPSPLATASPAQPDTPQSQSTTAPPQPAGASAPVSAPKKNAKKTTAKKRRHRRHKKRRHAAKKGHGGGRQRGRVGAGGAQTSSTDGPQIEITTEIVGDIREFNLLVAASEEVGVVGMRFAMRLHLEGANLGSGCYIGTVDDPIVVAPEKTKPESTYYFGHDPNGFKISLIGSGGTKLEDSTFAIPGATGCGIGGLLNGEINSLVGLPAPAGASRIVFGDNQFEFVGAGFDGIAPDGGAELQAAFDAAAG